MSPFVHPLLLQFEQYLREQRFNPAPAELYEPVNYVIRQGGKRIRPLLLLFSCNAYQGALHHALPAAFAIELFHNFTLIHDDVMDNASLRRGKEAVHKKFNLNTAILSGDVMMIWCYKYLQQVPREKFNQLFQLFNEMAIRVCEGQQMDMNFETRQQVSESEYLKMIEYKTSVLIAISLKMGALLGQATDAEAEKIYQVGLSLGMAFQLHDDLLDVFGDPAAMGKEKGGDIKNNKKTLLLIKAFELANQEQADQLRMLIPASAENHISTILQLIEATGARHYVERKALQYHEKAFSLLNELHITDDKKNELRLLADNLIRRKW